MLDRFPIGDEGRDTIGTNRPIANKSIPSRKYTRTAVLTGRSLWALESVCGCRMSLIEDETNLPKAYVEL
jgi:hypothetical protein